MVDVKIANHQEEGNQSGSLTTTNTRAHPGLGTLRHLFYHGVCR